MVPKYFNESETISGFNDGTYIEEGQFNLDQLDGTFGRRVNLNGSYKFGWFKGNGTKLHGFGMNMTSTKDEKGLYVLGVLKKEEIK